LIDFIINAGENIGSDFIALACSFLMVMLKRMGKVIYYYAILM
jgi:hypothetical protein